jgi:hypothetical protein
MGKEGRRKVLEEFNIKVEAKKLIKIWQRIHEKG